MKKEITKIGLFSAFKLYGAIYGAIGFIFGLLFALFSSFIPADASSELAPFTVAGPIMMVIGLPIFYGLIGAIAGALGALLYNVFAKFVGGIQIEVKDVSEFE